MSHGSQNAAWKLVDELLTRLRKCSTPDDYDQVQRAIFQCILQAEQLLGEARRCVKRLRRGEGLPVPMPEINSTLDPRELHTWEIQEAVFKRICRQFHAVGDALVWRVTGYDRAYVTVLSQNDAPGPMAPKDGLGYEIGTSVDIRQARGNLAVLHDLTNCLRIGDITEFCADGSRIVHEVKKDPARGATPKQLKRMQAAIDCMNLAGALPGVPDSRLVRGTGTCVAHVAPFAELVARAEEVGLAGGRLPQGRAVVIADVLAMGPRKLTQDSMRYYWDALRAETFLDAGIANAEHHITALSMTRNDGIFPTVVPIGAFPLTTTQCASIICDYTVFEFVLDPSVLVASLADVGVTASLCLPAAHNSLDQGVTVLTATRGTRRLDIAASALYELMFEVIDIVDWSRAVSEMLDDLTLPLHPVPVFHVNGDWQ